MKREILSSTAIDPLGLGIGHQLHKGPVGRYVNRLVAIIQVTANQIVLTYADPPYVSWSTPIDVATDCADLPFDSCIRDDGTIQLVYTESVTDYLVVRRLDFANGQWAPGVKSVVYDGGISQYPSVAVDDDGALWVAWTRSLGAIKYLHAKSSPDDGTTWGTGSADSGFQLTAGASSVYARLVTAPDALHAVFTEADWNILVCTRTNSAGAWDNAVLIAGSDVSGVDFDTAISGSGLLGVVFRRNGLQYREYDGNIWSAIQTLDSNVPISPQLQFQSDVPVITYLSDVAAGRRIMKFVTRTTGIFSVPEILDQRIDSFSRVLLYDATSGQYHDATAAAANDTVGDIYHPTSGALLYQKSDCIYLGMPDRFRLIHTTLATAGTGAAVTYSYWDSTAWKAFQPEGGAFDLDSIERTLILWADFHSIPAEWQQSVVNGSRLFWIKVEASGDFASAPVGTRIDAIALMTAWSVRR